MKGDPDKIRPIMTNSEQILQFGNNAYSKPATALDILRSTIMGPELFDFALKRMPKGGLLRDPAPQTFLGRWKMLRL